MYIVHETEIVQYQTLVLPMHQRTIRFPSESRFLEIPKSITLAIYDKINGYIDDGCICDFELNYRLNFGNPATCTNGNEFKTINEYIDWYWNSEFENNWGDHSPIFWSDFTKCLGSHKFHYLAKTYQPHKLKNYQEHIQNCSVCKDET